MIQARIHNGRVEVQEPIPDAWEGQLMQIVPLTPDDPVPDLEERFAALHALGPMEYEPGERERIARALNELNEASKQVMTQLGSDMQMVKLQVPDRDECAKAFAALIRRGRVDCFRDNVFLVPDPALQVLQVLGVTYVELGRGGLDYAQKALRDSAAAPIQ